MRIGIVILGTGHANILIILQLRLFFALNNALECSFLYQKPHSNTNGLFEEWIPHINHRPFREVDLTIQYYRFE